MQGIADAIVTNRLQNFVGIFSRKEQTLIQRCAATGCYKVSSCQAMRPAAVPRASSSPVAWSPWPSKARDRLSACALAALIEYLSQRKHSTEQAINISRVLKSAARPCSRHSASSVSSESALRSQNAGISAFWLDELEQSTKCAGSRTGKNYPEETVCPC